jgi:lysophospholipase L1-like esterase
VGRRVAIAVFLVGLTAAAFSSWPTAAPVQAAESKKQIYVVAAMGDSLTDPRSHGGKYLDVLRKKCPQSRFDSYGKGGNMVNQMRKRFAHDVLGDPPDPDEPKPAYTHLILLGGINDICSDESANRTNDKIKDDLTAMYDMARDRGMKVVALTLPPWGGFKKYYNRRRAASTFEINGWIKEQLAAGEVDALLDVFPVLSCGDPELLCDDYGMKDHVHWSTKGHDVVGEALYGAIFSDCL